MSNRRKTKSTKTRRPPHREHRRRSLLDLPMICDDCGREMAPVEDPVLAADLIEPPPAFLAGMGLTPWLCACGNQGWRSAWMSA